MNELTVLSWQNEAALGSYPLSRSIEYNNLLIDANFIQFDNFVPILKSISAENDKILFEIKFDRLTKTVEVNKVDLTGVAYHISIFDGTRYLGRLVLGADAVSLYNELISRRINCNIEFFPFLVKSIPSNCGIYSIEGLTGDVKFDSSSKIYFTVAGQNVTFDAYTLSSAVGTPYLKTLNGSAPVLNNIYIKESATLKVLGTGTNSVAFSLVGSSAENLVIDQNNTIITNPNPV